MTCETRGLPWIGLVGLALALCCGGEPEEPGTGLELRPRSGDATRAPSPPVEVPLGLPDDLPRYPGSQIVEFDNETYSDGITASFESSDPAEQVEAFFDAQLPAQGWEIEVSRHLSDAYIIFANNGELEVNVDVMTVDGGTRIELKLYPLGE